MDVPLSKWVLVVVAGSRFAFAGEVLERLGLQVGGDEQERGCGEGSQPLVGKKLPKRDRTILLLYYERDLTMKEIAQVLEITESRVSQLHASALFKLSVKLG